MEEQQTRPPTNSRENKNETNVESLVKNFERLIEHIFFLIEDVEYR